MEINITFLTDKNEIDLMDYSASIAEIGEDARRQTWNNSKESGHVFVRTEEEKQEARDYFCSFGAWEKEEIEAWDDTELNALILQDIAANLREYLRAKEGDDFEHWQENHGGSIYETEDGNFYFYLGH